MNKGKTNTPMLLETARTYKQIRDEEARKKNNRKNTQRYKVWSCTKCWGRSENPPKKADGTIYCSVCLIKLNEFVSMKQISTYKPKKR
jgi:hypothetical protein